MPPVDLRKLFKPRSVEEVAHLDSRGLQHVDVEPFVGVEIEHQAVWLVEMIERHAPIVNLNRADLHEPEQTCLAVKIKIGLLALAAGNGNLLDRVAHALHGVALEEALPLNSLRTADEADRAIDDIRENVGRDRLVVLGEVELGDANLRIEHLVGARERDAVEHRIALRLRFCCNAFCWSQFSLLAARNVTSHVSRRLVFAQALKAWMAQAAVARPFGIFHLADELRLEPYRVLALDRRHLDKGRLSSARAA